MSTTQTITITLVDTKTEQQFSMQVPVGISLLEAVHFHKENATLLQGACEGSLACTTCHVVVSNDWYDKLEESTEEEEDMLDLAFDVKSTSRLGCQIILTPELDGLVVHLPIATRNMQFNDALQDNKS